MTWAAVVAGGSAVVGGLTSAESAKNAAAASAAGSQAGIDEQRRQFDTIMGLNQPAIQTGNTARAQLASLLGLDVPTSNNAYGNGNESFSLNAVGSNSPYNFSISHKLLSNMGINVPEPPHTKALKFLGIGGTKKRDKPYGAQATVDEELQKFKDHPDQYDTHGELQAYLSATRPGAQQQMLEAIRNAGLSVFAEQPKPVAGQPGGPMSAEDVTKRLESLPGYQFAVNQARQGAGALGSATGSLGGNVLTALGDRIAGGIAAPTFENYLNRLSSLAGSAQTADSNVGNAAYNTGVGVANGLANIGDSRASGILGQQNSMNGVLEGLGGAFSGYMANRRNNQPAPPTNGSIYGPGGVLRG